MRPPLTIHITTVFDQYTRLCADRAVQKHTKKAFW